MHWALMLCGLVLIIQVLDMEREDRAEERERKARGQLTNADLRRMVKSGEIVPGVNYFGRMDF